LVAAGLLALVAIVVYSNFAKIKSGYIDPGMTTEVAALLLYGLGAYLVVGSMVVAVVVGGAMAVLLQFKKPLHANSTLSTRCLEVGESVLHKCCFTAGAWD